MCARRNQEGRRPVAAADGVPPAQPSSQPAPGGAAPGPAAPGPAAPVPGQPEPTEGQAPAPARRAETAVGQAAPGTADGVGTVDRPGTADGVGTVDGPGTVSLRRRRGSGVPLSARAADRPGTGAPSAAPVPDQARPRPDAGPGPRPRCRARHAPFPVVAATRGIYSHGGRHHGNPRAARRRAPGHPTQRGIPVDVTLTGKDSLVVTFRGNGRAAEPAEPQSRQGRQGRQTGGGWREGERERVSGWNGFVSAPGFGRTGSRSTGRGTARSGRR
jgi:hypothetical protein